MHTLIYNAIKSHSSKLETVLSQEGQRLPAVGSKALLETFGRTISSCVCVLYIISVHTNRHTPIYPNIIIYIAKVKTS